MSCGLLKKVNSKLFQDSFLNLLNEIGNKKVLIYGAGLAFQELRKRFDFSKLNIVGISDIKFTEEGVFEGIKAIPPSNINKNDFDLILMTLYYPEKAIESLKNSSQINKNTLVKNVFEEGVFREHEFLDYLENINFEKNLKKLVKKLKNKKIMLYGAGAFLVTIKNYYDISKLNIIGIADKKYETDKITKEFLGYKTYSPNEILEAKPDCVLVSTYKFVNIVDFLVSNILRDTKIKVVPFIKLSFINLIKEIWNS